MRLFAALLACASFFLSPGALAQQMAPDALVKSVTDEVLDIIRKDKDIKAGSTRRAIELVEQKVLPHFNFTRMTALAVGKDWRQATPEQQKVLTEEFRDLLVRTYSNALIAYKNESVDYRPFKMQPGETDVTVRTQIHQAGARQPITLDYSLEKNGNAWKVYDVVVAGVSLVTNYRSSFATEIRNGGIDGLIKTLKAKNASLEANVKK
ncbi:MAG: ABC transporter substrate-binding protein [Rhodocyclales bacterium]|jgi:phospholipid transport system substrate-binding protein|nr:ABC transporter substrate-binding protein [Rhodocyclales bacterium]CAG0973784.1 Intermembrane phospholipid transport system binding protein MlaC [Rhodocyclaceae bacterium]